MTYKENGSTVVNMEEVCTILTRDHGIEAYVGQTGGGTATILAGTVNDEGRYEALAGPGYFDGPAWTEGRGWAEDFSIGLDDDGETPETRIDDSWDEARIASVIAEHVKTARSA